jgi:tRNA-2-methylthio-N6-dimethylallyladenosine synthase
MAETSQMTAITLSTTSPAAQRGSYWITTFGCQMNKADSEHLHDPRQRRTEGV